jgi:cob(I)alamin adenosyltransferase
MTEDKAPREHENLPPSPKKGLIIVNTGDNKGKSTAAFGTALRCLGRGKKVAIIQFIKGKWKTGEITAFKKFGDQVTHYASGDVFTWETKDLEKDKASARGMWAKCKEVLHDDIHDLVIFDEINCVMDFDFLPTGEVVEELAKKPELKHVILTGRNAPDAIIEIADMATEMKKIKHPYDEGITAQPGIEY